MKEYLKHAGQEAELGEAGAAPMVQLEACAETHVRVALEDASMFDESALRTAGVEGIMHFKEGVSHLLVMSAYA